MVIYNELLEVMRSVLIIYKIRREEAMRRKAEDKKDKDDFE